MARVTRRGILKTGAAGLSLGLLGGEGPEAIGTPGDALGDPLDTRDFIDPGFIETFRVVPRFLTGRVIPAPWRPLTDPEFQWVAGYIHATQAAGYPAYRPRGAAWPAFSWLSSESAVYPNGDAIRIGGYSPFSAGTEGLSIIADHTPPHMAGLVPKDFGRGYLSGAMSSYPFAQTYGFFEMTGRVPHGKGLWPAFWLMPVSMQWPPENDVMEVLGGDTHSLYTTLHSRMFGGKETGKSTQHGFRTRTADLSAGFHAYGVDWGPETVRYYLDRKLVFSQPTPEDWHTPFYLLLNLGVGGPTSWPGAPDADTHFPARFQVRSVRAWQRRAYLPQRG